ncbi:MAG: tail fiber domain-containing protein, partial [Candidatus Woesearchaeota archaeon]|nr:tail fiber domain-containing protein [Candidatus Woesearchaeota archaeon]
PVFIAWDKSTGISITESQISDLSHTVDTNTQLTEGEVDAAVSNNGYLTSFTEIGDISGVTAGTGLTGGGAVGALIINAIGGVGISVAADSITIDPTYTQRRVSSSCVAGQSIRAIAEDGTVTCEVDTDTNTHAGTICGVGTFLNGDGSCDAGYLDADGTDAIDGGNAQTLDSIDSGSFLRSDVVDSLISTTKITGSLIHEDNTAMGYITHPKGGYYQTSTSSISGAIRICLPTYRVADMLGFKVDIFDYAGGSDGESITLDVNGYYYNDGTWNNEAVTIQSGRSDRDYNVRFGEENSKGCIWIGETTSPWSYPQVVVRDFFGGYSTDIDAYDDGWTVSIETTLGTIDDTISSNYIYSDWNKIKNIPTGFADGVDADTNTNAGTICGAGTFLNGDGSCDAVVVDTNTQLSEATVDSYVSDNGYLSSDVYVNTVGDTMTGDLSITKNNAWLEIDSSSAGGNGVEQGAGISIGESGYKGSAALHLTYTGDGYGHIGMGVVDSVTGLPAQEAIKFYYTNNDVTFLGDVTASAFYYSSDERLKKNIIPIDNALDNLEKLEGIKFNWRESGKSDIGFIAQDVEKVFPELVQTDNQTGMKSVKYGNIVAISVEAIKEQQELIDYLIEINKNQQKEIEEIKKELKKS